MSNQYSVILRAPKKTTKVELRLVNTRGISIRYLAIGQVIGNGIWDHLNNYVTCNQTNNQFLETIY